MGFRNETFSFEGNILTEVLGRDLTENFSVVLAEQIKNAKDADADKIVLDFSDFPNRIHIYDDGIGIEDLKSSWFTAGTELKKDNQDMLGGKGIGRFTLFALGKTLRVSTTAKGITQRFRLNTEQLKQDSSSGNMQVAVEELKDTTTPSGTDIVITDVIPEVLNYDEIRRDLKNLVSTEDAIDVDIKASDGSNDSYMSLKKGIKYSTLRASFEVQVTDEGYEVSQKITANLLSRSKILSKEPSERLQNFLNEAENAEHLSKLGKISFKLYHFYVPQKTQNEKKGRKVLMT